MVARETSIADGLAGLEVRPYRADAPTLLARLSHILETEAIDNGFLGPNERDRIVPRHVLDSAVLLRWVDPGHRVVDVGSGAGLPGMVLACCLPADALVLLDGQARRCDFLRRTAAALDLSVEVRQVRAEDASRTDLRESADIATARALAAPAVALELVLPLVRPGGRALLQVGGRPGSPDRPASDGWPGASGGTDRVFRKQGSTDGPSEGGQPVVEDLARIARVLGGGDPSLVGVDIPGDPDSRWVLDVPKLYPTEERYPRRPGVPARRPLG